MRKASVVGWVDDLGYLWCAECADVGGLVSGERVRAGGAPCSSECCDGCGRVLDAWRLLGAREGFEFWQQGDSVWRRRVSDWNVVMPDGTPGGVRREGSAEWFDRWISNAPSLV